MKNKRTWVVRIVAIVLAALMVLGICAVLFNTLALDGVPATGDTPTSKTPIYILVGAAALIAVCVAVPMIKKKK